MIYLDYAANCPTEDVVLEEFNYVTKKYFANPNSMHKFGKMTKKLINDKTAEIKNYLNVLDSEIIYTSGATESNNLAIFGLVNHPKVKGKHIITSPLEHSSIVSNLNSLAKSGYEIDILPLQEDGHVDINELKKLLREDTVLVTLNYVDSELGIVQPIKEVGDLLKDYPNCYFHVDASQAVGKIKTDFTNVDLVTITPHKFYGLSGVGLLIKKENVPLIPQIMAGKSTTIYRGGTPNTNLICATAKAIEIAINNLDRNYDYVKELNEKLVRSLTEIDGVIINSTINSIPYIINISVLNVDADELQTKLSDQEIYISRKSACSSSVLSTSLMALTNNKETATRTLRISLSYMTKEEEIEKFIELFKDCLLEIK